MAIYRCYFHEKDGATTRWQPIYSNSEADARLAALDVLRAHVHVEKLESGRALALYSTDP